MEITSNINKDLTDEIKSSSTVYTQEELNKAVEGENEIWEDAIIDCSNMMEICERVAEIRARSKDEK